MEIMRNFMVYSPRFAHRFIENYLGIIGNLSLVKTDEIDNFPTVSSVLTPWTIALGEHKMKYEYQMELSFKKYAIDIYIREIHMKDKYAPAETNGYFVVSCYVVIEKGVNKIFHSYVNHMFDSLDTHIREYVRENNKDQY